MLPYFQQLAPLHSGVVEIGIEYVDFNYGNNQFHRVPLGDIEGTRRRPKDNRYATALDSIVNGCAPCCKELIINAAYTGSLPPEVIPQGTLVTEKVVPLKWSNGVAVLAPIVTMGVSAALFFIDKDDYQNGDGSYKTDIATYKVIIATFGSLTLFSVAVFYILRKCVDIPRAEAIAWEQVMDDVDERDSSYHQTHERRNQRGNLAAEAAAQATHVAAVTHSNAIDRQTAALVSGMSVPVKKEPNLALEVGTIVTL